MNVDEASKFLWKCLECGSHGKEKDTFVECRSILNWMNYFTEKVFGRTGEKLTSKQNISKRSEILRGK